MHNSIKQYQLILLNIICSPATMHPERYVVEPFQLHGVLFAISNKHTTMVFVSSALLAKYCRVLFNNTQLSITNRSFAAFCRYQNPQT